MLFESSPLTLVFIFLSILLSVLFADIGCNQSYYPFNLLTGEYVVMSLFQPPKLIEPPKLVRPVLATAPAVVAASAIEYDMFADNTALPQVNFHTTFFLISRWNNMLSIFRLHKLVSLH